MKSTQTKASQPDFVKSVIAVIVLFGLVSCFGDIIYEGARSANGQYFNLLAINATTVGVIYGIGEFLGYALRLVSGKISDVTGKHWTMIFIGYGTLIVVPLMGLTTSIPVLCALFLLERIGKALRNPPKDTILSQIAQNAVGTGFVFGLQEALDQLGAFAGPMVFTAVFLSTGQETLESYQLGYRALFFAFILVMAAVWIAYRRVRKYDLTHQERINRQEDRLTGTFWLYCLFTFLTTFGFVAYSIIGFHLKAQGVLPDASITAFYSIAMVVDAGVALVIGRLYDMIKKRTGNRQAGLLTLAFIPAATAIIPFLTLGTHTAAAIAGLILYGVVLGTHETVMRSAIADLTSFKKRGTAYGIFNAAYGLAFLAGSSVMGVMYDHLPALSIGLVTIAAQAAALAVFVLLRRRVHQCGDAEPR
jgi:predicted MFS family arabinose efflux permease